MLRSLFFAAVLSAIAVPASADWVNGYYRSDGTYVQGHYRSAPNSTKADNYGPSRNEYERRNPYARDSDRDGTPNLNDRDDDNDGLQDDYDNSQY